MARHYVTDVKAVDTTDIWKERKKLYINLLLTYAKKPA